MLALINSYQSMAASGSPSEQTEVSVKINVNDAIKIVDYYQMKKIDRIDRYFDFYKDGRYALSKDVAPFKIRLMTTDKKEPKLQTSKLTKVSQFRCDEHLLRSQTKVVYESEGKGFSDRNFLESSLTNLERLHIQMIEGIENRSQSEYLSSLEGLSLAYKDLDFEFKDQLKALNIEDGFVASYTSVKEKYKTKIKGPLGQKLELSVTFSVNSCSKECVENDYTIEFQKLDAASDLDYTNAVCSVLKTLNLSEIRTSPDVNPVVAESLKNHIEMHQAR
jgi:hypothetical protein